MDRYITVTSTNQNPANFVSNFTDAVDFSSEYEVGLKSVFHAPINNVTDKNNTFSIKKGHIIEHYVITPGFYTDSCHLLEAIKNTLDSTVINDGSQILSTKPEFKYKAGGEQAVLRLSKGTFFSVDDKEPQLLHLLGFCVQGEFNEMNINVFAFLNKLNSGFLYSSIVGNSIIDHKQSRLLAIVPMHSKRGYNYHEFQNPVYNPLSVHSFSQASFVFTDEKGNELPMQYLEEGIIQNPTILVLHMRLHSR